MDNHFIPPDPSSSASSSRTVRAVPRQDGYYTPGLYMNPAGNATTESLNTLSTITPTTYGPVPPVRTSSLAVRGRHQAGIPGLVPPYPEGHLPSVQVTHPTPTKRRPRRHSEQEWEESPTKNTLDVHVDMDEIGLQQEEEDDLGDAERQKEVQEARKARAREKGRERQRRKRERDKKAKEDARSTSSNTPTTAPVPSSHLPIPPRSSSAANLSQLSMTPHSYPFTMSVPSSTSSSYSALPQPNLYGTLSPSTNTSFASMSVSGQSSPGALFSPAISTPAMTSDGWSDGVIMDKRKPKSPVPPVPPIPVELKRHKPSKRRKSEPQPEDFKSAEVGLGVMIDPSWQPPAADRPKYRRTHSEGASVPLSDNRARSSTPPPVSTPSGYLTPEPSQAGAFFATTVLVALGMSGLGRTLEDQLGMGESGLEEIKGDLAGVFDRWRLAQGLRDVTLSSGPTRAEDQEMDDHMGSPQRPTVDTSFFTPAPIRTTRQGVPQSMPQFQQIQSYSPQQLEPVESGHSRTRSLSSASMAARGLVINPGNAVQPWMHSESEGQSTSPTIQTPSTGQGSFPSAESLGMVASQNLQTHHGQMFGHVRSATEPQQRHYTTRPDQAAPSMEMTRGGSTSDTTDTSSDWTKVPSPLDSPLAMAHRRNQSPMAPPATMPRHQYRPNPPPPPSFVPMSGLEYSTPQSQRTFRQVPFTPPTLVHGHQDQMNMGMLSGNGDGMTMFYDPNATMPVAYQDGMGQGPHGHGSMGQGQ